MQCLNFRSESFCTLCPAIFLLSVVCLWLLAAYSSCLPTTEGQSYQSLPQFPAKTFDPSTGFPKDGYYNNAATHSVCPIAAFRLADRYPYI